MEIDKRMYVIVRGDLDSTYRMVQGAHGISQFALRHNDLFRQWNNEKIVFLKTFNGLRMDDLKNDLVNDAIIHAHFNEPDLGDKVTSLVVFDDGSGKAYNALKHLKLN